jgi:hypothetical protein
MVTVDEVEAEVARIRAMAADDEAAHSAEDDLWHRVLETIASGQGDTPWRLAKAALKTKEIEFQRWCA